MDMTTTAAPTKLPNLTALYGRFEARLLSLDRLKGLSLLAIRLWLAQFFFFSGLTKIKSWTTTIALFTDEYHVPVLSPQIAAALSATAELSLPVLLVIGLFNRFAALGLFCMTLVIELFVYPGTTENYYIMLLTTALIANGSGMFGADYWLAKKA